MRGDALCEDILTAVTYRNVCVSKLTNIGRTRFSLCMRRAIPREFKMKVLLPLETECQSPYNRDVRVVLQSDPLCKQSVSNTSRLVLDQLDA
jgi:hypothetical protein